MRRLWARAALAAAVLALAGCERASTTARGHEGDASSTSAYAPREGAAADAGRGADTGGRYASRGADAAGSAGEDRSSAERAPTPMFKGDPLWSDNRRYSAEENAHYHCSKSGPDIGATGYDDCLTKVHAFVDHPPSDVETLTRANGDRLMYDPKANLFAVARKDGAPRTFFKPRTGAQYWAEQKSREASGGGYGRRGYGRGSEGADQGAGQ